MGVSVFVTIWMTAYSAVALNDHFAGDPLSYLKSNPDVNAVEFYTPYTGDVPRLDDIPAPHLIVEIHMDSESAATALTSSDKFRQHFVNQTGVLSRAEKINLEVLEPLHFDVPGHETPPPRKAPFSFVVRYYGPVADAADFADFYVTNHPPLLAEFPNIRNVLCYVPPGWRKRGELTDDSLVIGNEVVFDNLEDFKAAISSDAMDAVMADSEQFKSYGYSSHHAMHREFVFQR